jgi:GMP synthase (glutamine-hydrolysing)
MKPFLLLQTRPENEASDNEYQGFLLASGLMPQQLERIRVDMAPMPTLYLEQYSGIILGGGPYNVSTPQIYKTPNQIRVERDIYKLLTTIVEQDYPFFGACLGIGMLGKHQGGVINDRYAEGVGPVDVTLTLDGRGDPLLSEMPETFQAIVGHKEACETLPPNAVLLASSPACPIQMFRIKKNLYATQFHPELDMDGLEVRVEVYKHAGYFPPEDAEKILEGARRADLSYAPQILRNFVHRYRQA